MGNWLGQANSVTWLPEGQAGIQVLSSPEVVVSGMMGSFFLCFSETHPPQLAPILLTRGVKDFQITEPQKKASNSNIQQNPRREKNDT